MYAIEQVKPDPFLTLGDIPEFGGLGEGDSTFDTAKLVLAIPDLSTLAVTGGFLTNPINLVLRPIGAAITGIHGYKRYSSSVETGIVFGIAGFFFPVIGTIVSIAQGYGKPKR